MPLPHFSPDGIVLHSLFEGNSKTPSSAIDIVDGVVTLMHRGHGSMHASEAPFFKKWKPLGYKAERRMEVD